MTRAARDRAANAEMEQKRRKKRSCLMAAPFSAELFANNSARGGYYKSVIEIN